MSEKKKVLIVDDDKTGMIILEELLISNHYEVKCINSGLNIVEELGSFAADVIILDIDMPGKSGFEVCCDIKDDLDYAEIPIVFVSAFDSIDERINAYDAGGDDYIIKPVEHDELLAKLSVILKKIDKINSLQTDYKTAFDTAMQAMTSASEIGVVMQFLDGIISCETYDELIESLFSIAASFELDCSLQIRYADGMVLASSEGEIKQIEAELFDAARNAGRFFDSGAKTFVNYKNISFLIKNMPVDDESKYGRIKDYIAPMINGADSRIRVIESATQFKQKQMALSAVLKEAQSAEVKVNNKLEEFKQINDRVFAQLVDELAIKIAPLGLGDENNSSIIKIIEDKKVLLQEPYNIEMKIEALFAGLIAKISRAIA